jgi:hypothetical protein
MSASDRPVRPYTAPAGRILGTVVDLTLSKGGASADSFKGIPIPGPS